MAGITIGQQVLERVVQRLGGLHPAATLLGVTPSLLERFLQGTMAVPDSLLLKAVDVTLDSKPPEPVPAVRPASPPPKGPIVI